jgi:hypothetical protein
MSLLRRVLGIGAALLVATGFPLTSIPGTILERLLGQRPLGDDVWVRVFGVALIVLGLFHVLIIRKLEDVWWWCWSFVIFDGVSAIVVLVHAAIGVPEGSAVWPWWVYGATSGVFAALYLVGIARAGQEKPFV